MIPYILTALVGYLIGTFSPSYFLSLIKKKNLRNEGSKNLGASNTAIVLGWKWGIVVALIDIFKCAIPTLILNYFLLTDIPYLPYIYAAFCIIGHIFPFYLKFKGGKGFACLYGAIIGLDYKVAIIYGVAIILITVITDYIIIATITTALTFPIGMVILNHSYVYGLILAVPASIIILKHLVNVKRIINKEEIGLRASFKKKKSN